MTDLGLATRRDGRTTEAIRQKIFPQLFVSHTSLDVHHLRESMKSTTAVVLLVGIGSFGSISNAAANEPLFSTSQICKAGISLVMGKSPTIMKTDVVGGEVRVSYVRPDDGSTWKYKCKVEGSRVLWGSDPGRWRTDPADEPMSYFTTGKGESALLTVEEKYQDGSSNKKSFTASELK